MSPAMARAVCVTCDACGHLIPAREARATGALHYVHANVFGCVAASMRPIEPRRPRAEKIDPIGSSTEGKFTLRGTR